MELRPHLRKALKAKRDQIKETGDKDLSLEIIQKLHLIITKCQREAPGPEINPDNLSLVEREDRLLLYHCGEILRLAIQRYKIANPGVALQKVPISNSSVPKKPFKVKLHERRFLKSMHIKVEDDEIED
ncbi:hypothetical protein KW791_01390 [Candidatus Parcubacteria bacterium]|nr:hypothetical protein [Candidatus Parcubacteria bacterium]